MQRAKLDRCTTEATSAWCDVISRGHHDRVDYSDRCSGFAAKTCFTFRRSRMIGSTLSEGASAPASRHGRSALRMMMVGLPGFEPGTSCPPDKRANQAAPQPVSQQRLRSFERNARLADCVHCASWNDRIMLNEAPLSDSLLQLEVRSRESRCSDLLLPSRFQRERPRDIQKRLVRGSGALHCRQ